MEWSGLGRLQWTLVIHDIEMMAWKWVYDYLREICRTCSGNLTSENGSGGFEYSSRLHFGCAGFIGVSISSLYANSLVYGRWSRTPPHTAMIE